MNNCYASIELLHRPELRGRPLAVGGDPEARHGIVLAKDLIAKKAGVKTGMALWQAREVCPDVVFVPPRMDLYLRFSRRIRDIYAEYTDKQEAFGIDESWLDVTESVTSSKDGYLIAEEIRRRAKEELGVTVSVGVSWNKIFAKFGSDYKKPDAVTVIDKDNYKDIVWTSPVGDILYVGRSNARRLNDIGIMTIGQLASADRNYLKESMGKMGLILSAFARGEDQTPVSAEGYSAPIKSIGNSTTTPRDLKTNEDVKIVTYLLAESVSARLRENNFKCRVVEISVRDNNLYTFTRQMRTESPTNITSEIASYAMKLFTGSYDWSKPIRSVGVRGVDLVDASIPIQLNMFLNQEERDKQHKIDLAIDNLRGRFGFYSVQRGMMYLDRSLSKLNAREDHVTHPRGYFANGNQSGVG
ncbi:MAG: DNA polymerase IV [Saccharofermentans sp.]|nr:DNA polymerase IV [Saccharofermentans sp.]